MIHTKDLFAGGKLVDEKSLEMLTQVIEKNNLPGFDYYEFKRSVMMLKEMSLEEAVAFKSAFQTASTVGVTKEKLVETAQYYRNLMTKEQENFTAALEKQHQVRITDRKSEIGRLIDQIARHEAELTRLQEEIAVYKEQTATAEKNLGADADKLAATRTGFETTLQTVLTTIDTDIEMIHKYL